MSNRFHSLISQSHKPKWSIQPSLSLLKRLHSHRAHRLLGQTHPQNRFARNRRELCHRLYVQLQHLSNWQRRSMKKQEPKSPHLSYKSEPISMSWSSNPTVSGPIKRLRLPIHSLRWIPALSERIRDDQHSNRT